MFNVRNQTLTFTYFNFNKHVINSILYILFLKFSNLNFHTFIKQIANNNNDNWCEFTGTLFIFAFHLSSLHMTAGEVHGLTYTLSKERSTQFGKKLLGFNWEKTIYWPLFVLANTL